ncbi:MAG TPA: class I adenylate-forming enzyme family protein, partial [Spongiibacteraceae bacterium]|nr:class I adenylate-forming enzyme family protein [Spongiibacteraceae bacterium]
RNPAKTAVVIEAKAYTYADLWAAASRLSGFLIERGLQRGDRVAIYMDNTWPCVVSIYAAAYAGGVFLMVNPQTKADKLDFILRDSGARFLLTDAHLATSFLPVVAGLAALECVICSGSAPIDARIVAFDTAVNTSGEQSLRTRVGISLDLAALIYTSGSTGNPKGVMQTHQSMLFAMDSLIRYLRLRETDRILCVLPMSFDYGLYQLFMTIRLGATLVLERSFTFPAQIFARMTEQEVTVFPGVPTIFAMLLSIHGRSPLCFPGVTRVTNTAAALPDDFVPRLREIFPNALIYRMYGLTECKRVSYLEPELADQLPGSVGKAIPGTEVFLLTPEGEPVAPGEIGVLHVRGPHVMLGYWNQPELTAKMLRPGAVSGERVLCTHDHFRMDQEGYLYFIGRNDDIIKSRGEKVSPVEVENAMYKIAGVREVAVVGVADEVLGQAIRAFVVLEDGVQFTEKQLRLQCMARLENYMVPRDIVFCSEFPKTSTGKVSKRLLMEQYPS